jgi:purine-binding chemotaxis protein CheW
MKLSHAQAAEQIVADYLSALLKPATAEDDVAVERTSAPELAGHEGMGQESAAQAYAPEPQWEVALPEAALPAPTHSIPRYLLCSAAGVRLALPMREVRHVLPMPPLITSADDLPLCLGSWRHPGGEARVADLAGVLSADMAGSPASTLVLLNDRSWALACVVDDEPVHLEADAIQWRSAGGARPWLAGMVRELRCGVLDADALIDMLETPPEMKDHA